MMNKYKSLIRLGTEVARSFLDIAKSLEAAMERTINLEFIDMPEQCRGTYQYYTQADMVKLTSKSIEFRFASLEDGVADYVRPFLSREDRYR